MDPVTCLNESLVSDVPSVNELNEDRGLHLYPLTSLNDGHVSNVRGINELNEGRGLHLYPLTSVNDGLISSVRGLTSLTRAGAYIVKPYIVRCKPLLTLPSGEPQRL